MCHGEPDGGTTVARFRDSSDLPIRRASQPSAESLHAYTRHEREATVDVARAEQGRSRNMAVTARTTRSESGHPSATPGPGPPQRDGYDRSGEPHDEIRVTIPQAALIRILLAIAALLTIAHLLVSLNRYQLNIQFFGADNLYVLFDMWGEVSIPSWYSVSLLLTCAGLLAIVAIGKWQRHDRFARHWTALALIFLALSIDDASDIHGQASYRIQATLETGGALAYAWVIPGMIFTVLAGLAYARFLAHLPRSVRLRFLLAGGLFLTGALVMEMIEARYDSIHGVENMPYRLMVAVEESLEMVGVILFISTLLGYLATMSESIRLRISRN